MLSFNHYGQTRVNSRNIFSLVLLCNSWCIYTRKQTAGNGISNKAKINAKMNDQKTELKKMDVRKMKQ